MSIEKRALWLCLFAVAIVSVNGVETTQAKSRSYSRSITSTKKYYSHSVCYCLAYARAVTHKGKAVYSASVHPINSKKPKVGAIVLMYSGPLGHAAVVTKVTPTTISLKEKGWVSCNTVSYRTIARNSRSIRGYWL